MKKTDDAALPRLLTLQESADILNTSLKTLRRRIDDGQLPVIRDGEVLGTVHEQGVLHLLLDDPDARNRLVQDVMDRALDIVEGELTMGQLSPHLERPPHAVLVRSGKAGYGILTKSDLISAIAGIRRS